jgi:flagellar secretion chaperone FliS
MNPHTVYQEQYQASETRIELLLDLFERAILRLEQAGEAFRRNDPEEAMTLLVKAQVLVEAIASGIDLNQGQLAIDLLRLYEFAVFSMRKRSAASVETALKVLRPLYEGFQAIRSEACDLERTGTISRAGESPSIQAIA